MCVLKTLKVDNNARWTEMLGWRHHSSWTLASLDDREQRFEKLNKDLVAVLQLKAYVVGLHPSEVLDKTKSFIISHS